MLYCGIGVPCGRIDAVGVLLKGGKRCGRIQVPELDGIIPAACKECVPPDHIPVDAIYLQIAAALTPLLHSACQSWRKQESQAC